jgi:hypothetical protein
VDVLISLLDKSLLQRDERGRLALHELLRQFGEENLLSESARCAEVRNGHSAFYLQFLRQSLELAIEDLMAYFEMQNFLQGFEVFNDSVQHLEAGGFVDLLGMALMARGLFRSIWRGIRTPSSAPRKPSRL